MGESRTFESLHALVAGIQTARSAADREVRWVEGSRLLGIARDSNGSFELFLRCPKLEASSSIARHLQFEEWEDSGGKRFHANRLVLPPQPHFGPVAAFLAEELFRNGLGSGTPQDAFEASEPLIEMALRRVGLSEDTQVGLIGELRYLDLLLSISDDGTARARAMEAWRGFDRSTHDFVLGRRAVEVKTTLGASSTHYISSIWQVDPRRDPNGQPEQDLYLLSIGLTRASPTDGEPQGVPGLSLPSMVEQILAKLGPSTARGARNEIQELFLKRVGQYGADEERGYEHDRMGRWGAYSSRYVHRFHRVYYMNDPAVRVLRAADFEDRYVEPQSVRAVIALPDQIRGDLNPTDDLHAAARMFLDGDG